MISRSKANQLRPLLEAFLQSAPVAQRLRFDPVELPRRFTDPRDIEVVGLLSAALAYGRADLFKPKLEGLLTPMGSSPARFVSQLNLSAATELLRDFVYRFNVGTDVAVLLLGMGRALKEHGSLERVFELQWNKTRDLHAALAGFIRTLRDVPMPPLRKALGRERGLHHLLPHPLGTGAAKRLNLYLRWMVRGPDAVDFGIWKSLKPAGLLIPLDTHIARISKRLALTRRNDLSWKTAAEITASLRCLDPEDPIKYDFALCHYGMCGVCPAQAKAQTCAPCLLRPSCATGKRLVPQPKA